MEDVEAKFHKLAQEYAKVKQKNSVLKKAVLEEKSKFAALQKNWDEGVKEAKEFKDSLREKDQTVRKCMQEIDSLGFRNQQLSKRVIVLQEELEQSRRGGGSGGGKKSKGSGLPSPAFASDVHAQELQSKIRENEKLHKEIYEIANEKQSRIEDLMRQLEEAKSERDGKSSALEETNQQHRMAFENLQQEKVKLESHVHALEAELKTIRIQASSSESELKFVKEDMSTQLDTMTRVITEKLAFNDSIKPHFNAMNVPLYDRKYQKQSQDLIAQGAKLLKDFVAALSNYLSYTEQRVQAFCSDVGSGSELSVANEKYCHFLHQHASYLRPLNSTYSSFKESIRPDVPITWEVIRDLQQFVSAHHQFSNYLEKLQPYQLISIEEECGQSTCTATLRARNMDLRKTVQRLAAAHAKMDQYLQAIITCVSLSRVAQANLPVVFKKFSLSLEQLNRVYKDLSSQYASKVALEHQLPTAGQRLKTTDECILSSLTATINASGKIFSFIESNLDFLVGSSSDVSSPSSGGGTKTKAACVAAFRKQARGYMEKLARPPAVSVPYELALRSSRDVLSSSESRMTLSEQIDICRGKISKLEQEREHWMLESQLIQIKHEKEQTKNASLQEEMSRLRDELSLSAAGGAGSPSLIRAATSLHQASKTLPQSLPVFKSAEEYNKIVAPKLGLVSVVSQDGEEEEQETREVLIKNHFSARIIQMNRQFQEADAKSVHLEAECRALHKHLSLSEKTKEKLVGEVDGSHDKIKKLEDELQTTTHSYEAQLSMMSDHLCTLNDKLTAQREEIEEFKASKGKKKK